MIDTLIIGAGMSGLAAGIRLAYFGQKVTILERHTTIGGLNSFYRLAGRNHDVGLHAVTNYTPAGSKKGPLAKLLRQLRFVRDDFALAPQIGSSVVFPGTRLDFDNNPATLEQSIRDAFPAQIDNFRRLQGRILDYDELDEVSFTLSTRQILGEIFDDPLLIEMLLCPLMWYGNARERDMDFGQFCIMFRAIFSEGFARPFAGVRLILRTLVKRFKSLGGDLRLRHGVQSIKTDNGRAIGVVLDDGRELEARRILSSAGRIETLRLCDDITAPEVIEPGVMSFTECISVLDRPPATFGHDRTVVFYNDSETFHWERPKSGLIDVRTGVVCSPNNFAYAPGQELPEGVIRVTTIADFDRWNALSESEYRLAKLDTFDRVNASATRFVPDYRRHIVDSDMFTPTTIRRFTWHENGAVYGAPEKILDGRTHLPNVFLCGTDQGFVGIIGSIISGISIANQHCLIDQAGAGV